MLLILRFIKKIFQPGYRNSLYLSYVLPVGGCSHGKKGVVQGGRLLYSAEPRRGIRIDPLFKACLNGRSPEAYASKDQLNNTSRSCYYYRPFVWAFGGGRSAGWRDAGAASVAPLDPKKRKLPSKNMPFGGYADPSFGSMVPSQRSPCGAPSGRPR